MFGDHSCLFLLWPESTADFVALAPMLRKIGPTHAESEAGFSVRSGPKGCWIYSKGDKQIYITSEAAHFGAAGWGEYIYT